MAERKTNPQMTMNAQRDGLALGMYWMLTMGMFICQFAVPVCSTIWLFLMLYTPFYVGSQASRHAIREQEGFATFSGAYFYSLIVYICGALILSLAFWIYLRYMDDGYLIDKYTAALTDPRVAETMKKIGYDEMMIKDAKAAGEQLSTALHTMRPIDITLQLLWVNIVTSGIISVISALFCKLTLYFRRRNS